MSQDKYLELAKRAIAELEKIQSAKETISRFPDTENVDATGRLLVLSRLVYNAEGQLRSLFIQFGHNEVALTFLACHLEADMIEFYRDQARDMVAFNQIPALTDEHLAKASLLEIEELLPIVSSFVDRCAALTVAWPLPSA